MILRQFLHSDPVAASYCSAAAGKAPPRSSIRSATSRPISRRPKRPGCASATSSTPISTPTTVSPARALADAAGADYVLFAGAKADFPFRGVRDGDVLELGNVIAHGPAHARPYAGTHLAAGHRPDARGRAVVRADRPHADGRRSRPHRTCHQRRGGRARSVPQRAAAEEPCPTISKCCREPIPARSAGAA